MRDKILYWLRVVFLIGTAIIFLALFVFGSIYLVSKSTSYIILVVCWLGALVVILIVDDQ